MGIWFLGASVGNFLGGQAASFYETMPLADAARAGRRAADASPASLMLLFREARSRRCMGGVK